MENISEYFDPDTLRKIITSFRSEHRNNKVILDYALPDEIISPVYKILSGNIFKLIIEESNSKTISHYSKEDLSGIFSGCKGELIVSNSMKEIEFRRTGKNEYFRNVNDGWIECSVWKL